MKRFAAIFCPAVLVPACLLLSGCAQSDPSNIGGYFSCSDWMMTHGAAPVRRRTGDQATANARVLEDWVLARALDRGYEVTDAPVSDNRAIGEKALIDMVTVQCRSDRVFLTLGGAIAVVLDRLDVERGRPSSR